MKDPKVAVVVVLATAVVTAALTLDASRCQQALTWARDHRGAGAVAFFFAYTLCVVLMLPAMALGMAAGAAFGLVKGTALSWCGSVLGQTVAFALARYALRDAVAARLSKAFPKWPAIDRALGSQGWKLVVLLRLSPITPWNLLNYALGVTAVTPASYFVASAVSIFPYLCLFVYAGTLARSFADVLTGAASPLGGKFGPAMAALGGLAMALALALTTRISRRAIAEALRDQPLPPELTSDAEVMSLLNAWELGGDAGLGRLSHEGPILSAGQSFGSSLGRAFGQDFASGAGFAVQMTPASTAPHARSQAQLLRIRVIQEGEDSAIAEGGPAPGPVPPGTVASSLSMPPHGSSLAALASSLGQNLVGPALPPEGAGRAGGGGGEGGSGGGLGLATAGAPSPAARSVTAPGRVQAGGASSIRAMPNGLASTGFPFTGAPDGSGSPPPSSPLAVGSSPGPRQRLEARPSPPADLAGPIVLSPKSPQPLRGRIHALLPAGI